MHDERLSAHRTLGTRSGPRYDAGSPRSPPRCDAPTPANRRTSFRNAQSLDGLSAFPDQAAASRQYRDEPPCAGLQSQTRHANHGDRAADASDAGLRPSSPARYTPQDRFPNAFAKQLSKNPRPTQSRPALAHSAAAALPYASELLTRRDHAEFLFPHSLDPERSSSPTKTGRSITEAGALNGRRTPKPK